MATKKPAIEKPLTTRQQSELTLFAGLVAGTADKVLRADNGEVYANLIAEAVHAYDVFHQLRVEGVQS